MTAQTQPINQVAGAADCPYTAYGGVVQPLYSVSGVAEYPLVVYGRTRQPKNRVRSSGYVGTFTVAGNTNQPANLSVGSAYTPNLGSGVIRQIVTQMSGLAAPSVFRTALGAILQPGNQSAGAGVSGRGAIGLTAQPLNQCRTTATVARTASGVVRQKVNQAKGRVLSTATASTLSFSDYANDDEPSIDTTSPTPLEFERS